MDPGRIESCLDPRGDRTPGQTFNGEEYEFEAVKAGDRQQVEDPHVDGDKGRQAQHIQPAILHRLADGADDPHRPGKAG